MTVEHDFAGTGAMTNALGGETAQQLSGTWERVSGEAQRTTNVDGEMLVFDCGNTNHTCEVTITAALGFHGAAARTIDTANYFVAYWNTSSAVTQLYVNVAGVFTPLGSNGGNLVSGSVLGVNCQGTTISLLIDGVQQTSATNASHSTGTRAGLRAGGVGTGVQQPYQHLLITTVSTTTTPPTYFNSGAAVTGTTASLTPQWPASHAVNDIGVLVIETTGNGGTIATPSGWTLATTVTTDVATTAGSKTHVFLRRATSTNENANPPSTGGTGAFTDHGLARIHVFRGVDPGASLATLPVAVTAKASASTTLTFPSVTTAVDNSLIVFVGFRPNDSAGVAEFTTVTGGTSLTNHAEHVESGTQSGNGGGFVVGSATKATAGTTGAPTMTTASLTGVTYTIALPPIPVRIPRVMRAILQAVQRSASW